MPANAAKFFCRSCGYESGLNIVECPECGRVGRPAEAAAAGGYNKKASGSDSPPATPPRRRPAQLSSVSLCRHCGYRTPNLVAECPGCGRLESFESVAPAPGEARAVEGAADQGDLKYEAGKFLQLLAPGFLFVAILVFLGFGPTGRTPRGGLVADPGENWAGALILLTIGIVLVAVGARLKR